MENTNESLHEERLARAHLALSGLSVGDAFGETFFANPDVVEGLIEQRAIAQEPWRWTDDTAMAVSIVRNLSRFGAIQEDALVEDFVAGFDFRRGYGPALSSAIREIREGGAHWRDIFAGLFGGRGSYGNGAAMRVAPLGAYFADADFATIVEQATLSAAPTHSHPEGIAGAIAVAVAAAIAWRSRGTKPGRKAFLSEILRHVPDSVTAEKIRRARDFDTGVSMRFAASVLGTGVLVSSQDTVPFALFCAGEWLTDFEEALWQTVSGLGDRDTTCAIVGGIVALHTGESGIPSDWRAAREPLPEI